MICMILWLCHDREPENRNFCRYVVKYSNRRDTWLMIIWKIYIYWNKNCWLQIKFEIKTSIYRFSKFLLSLKSDYYQNHKIEEFEMSNVIKCMKQTVSHIPFIFFDRTRNEEKY